MIRAADLLRLVVSWLLTTLALGLTVELVPGLSVDSWWPLLLAAAVTGIVGMLVRPLLVQVVALLGWWAVALAALAGQALVMMLALSVVPEVHYDNFWTIVLASWVAAFIGTLLAWIFTAGTDESFSAALLNTKASKVSDPEVDGVLFVQLDGVSFPVMEWALQSGTMPTLRRWLGEGSHELHEWTVQLPCTTPASQQAILHGTAVGVPAFRWYDRELGRVLVANRPEDAAIIEKRASNGRGLLVDDGISVSNLFTGDAPRASMTMSRLEVARGSRRTRQVFARFLIRPDGLARSVSRTFAEIFRERFQAIRQRRLGVEPRVHRSWTFAGLRAFSNGLLRDLNTAVVAEEMMHGTRVIYVDYVDYDEIAHHAGGTRLESVAALGGLDQALKILAKVAERAPRRYHIVALSDHGQSQGAPFAARFDTDLSGLCAELTHVTTAGVEESVEGWGRMDSVLQDIAGTDGESNKMSQRVSKRVDENIAAPAASDGADLVVLGSGNLGLVYVPGPERLTLDQLEARWPRLVTGLSSHPGIGFVAVMAADGPMAIGPRGRRHLATGEVEGEDPMAPFAKHSADMLLTAAARPEAPDLYVNSTVDPHNLEIAAFEPLVGAHGGLGGWQDRGFVLASPALLAPPEPIYGGEELHQYLVAILEKLGHRAGLIEPDSSGGTS